MRVNNNNNIFMTRIDSLRLAGHRRKRWKPDLFSFACLANLLFRNYNNVLMRDKKGNNKL